MEILLARYKESVEWARHLPNVTVVNKGEPLDEEMRELRMPNVGREGHTYYKYIVDHYDDLPEYLLCLQAHPFDHSPNILLKIQSWLNAAPGQLPDYATVSEKVLPCNLLRCPYAGPLPMIPIYEMLFGQRPTFTDFTFGAGAQFIVSRRRILQRPRSFYEKIVRLLEYSPDPTEGHVIERFHGFVFG